MLSAENYKNEVLWLEYWLLNGRRTNDIAEFIGSGSESLVYRYRHSCDNVIKFPADGNSSKINRDFLARQEWVRKQRERLTRGLGCVGIEQLVEIHEGSPTAVLTKHAGHQNLYDMQSNGSIALITQRECEGLLVAASAMHDLGLSIDPAMRSNVVHRWGSGFTIIDYRLAEEEPQTLDQKVQGLASMFCDEQIALLTPQLLEFRRAAKALFGAEVLALVDTQWLMGEDSHGNRYADFFK